ncbi:MAG: sigma factor, partial [Pseudomonadota bacterium]
MSETRSARLQALERAIREHDAVLVRWLTARFGDGDLARDIAQSAYLRVWRFAQDGDVENPRTLIFKTASNVAANEFRSR